MDSLRTTKTKIMRALVISKFTEIVVSESILIPSAMLPKSSPLP